MNLTYCILKITFVALLFSNFFYVPSSYLIFIIFFFFLCMSSTFPVSASIHVCSLYMCSRSCAPLFVSISLSILSLLFYLSRSSSLSVCVCFCRSFSLPALDICVCLLHLLRDFCVYVSGCPSDFLILFVLISDMFLLISFLHFWYMRMPIVVAVSSCSLGWGLLCCMLFRFLTVFCLLQVSVSLMQLLQHVWGIIPLCLLCSACLYLFVCVVLYSVHLCLGIFLLLSVHVCRLSFCLWVFLCMCVCVSVILHTIFVSICVA